MYAMAYPFTLVKHRRANGSMASTSFRNPYTPAEVQANCTASTPLGYIAIMLGFSPACRSMITQSDDRRAMRRATPEPDTALSHVGRLIRIVRHPLLQTPGGIRKRPRTRTISAPHEQLGLLGVKVHAVERRPGGERIQRAECELILKP